MRLTPDQAAGLPGATVFDAQDEELGSVEELFLDAGDDQPAWAAVALEDRTALVPLDGAELDGAELRVRYPRDLVAGAPEVEGDALDASAQQALYAHYGLVDADLRDDTGWSTGRASARTQGSARDAGGSEGAAGADRAHP